MSQITVSLRGSLRLPALTGGDPSASYTNARLLAGLYELREGETVRQVNQPVEIAEVDSLGPPHGLFGSGGPGNFDRSGDPSLSGAAGGLGGTAWSKEYDFRADFRGLQATAVEHPLLAATVAKRDDRSDLCLGVRVVVERRDDPDADVDALEVVAFGGVIIDTQGVALGSEVHATVLMYECAGSTRYHDSLLRKVFEGEGERLITAGELSQRAREEHIEVSFTSSSSARRQGGDPATGRPGLIGNSGTCVSRSLVNTWDRAARNSVVVSVEALGADDRATGGERALDITARLVNGHDRVITLGLCDAVGEGSSAEDSVALPRLWLPLPADEPPAGCWRHSFFTATGILNAQSNTEGLYIVLSVGDGREDIEILLREGRSGFDPNVFLSSPSMTFEHDGVRFAITVRLFSSELPVSSALATVVSCGSLGAAGTAGAEAVEILAALSSNNIMASDFSEVEPFVVPLLNGAFTLVRAHAKDSGICMQAGVLAMRIFASADACGGRLAHAVGTYVARSFAIPDIGVKMLYIVAIAVEGDGGGAGLSLPRNSTKTGGLQARIQKWPLKISGPGASNYVLEHAWVTMVQLAFRSHRISLGAFGRACGGLSLREEQRPNSSSQLLMEGLSKTLKTVAQWTTRKMKGRADHDQACAAHAMATLRDIVGTALEHLPDASAVLVPLETFLEGLLPITSAGNSEYPPAVAVAEVMIGIRKCFAVPAIEQAMVAQDDHHLALISLFRTLIRAVREMLPHNTDGQDNNSFSCSTSSSASAASSAVGIIESMTTLRQALTLMKLHSSMWWDCGPTRQTDMLVDLLVEMSSCAGAIGADKESLESAGLLVCAASEVFKRASWEKVRLYCEKEDTSAGRFLSICNMFYGSLNCYCRSQLRPPEPVVGASLVGLIHVLFGANSSTDVYRRTALKLVPRCHMILRSSNGTNLDMHASLNTDVFETLPASCAALLMQHSQSLPESSDTSNYALRVSFEIAWIEALIPLLGDVDVFVNETAATCLEHRLAIILNIVSDASAQAPTKRVVATILSSLPRRVAKRLHTMCSSFPSSSMTRHYSSSWDCLSTASAWWFKPRQLYNHVVNVGAPLSEYMDPVAQFCLLYAQLWDANPEVSTMVPLCGSKQDALPVFMSLCHTLTSAGLPREAASCLAVASRWHSPRSLLTSSVIQDNSKWEVQTSAYATGMCLASAASLLRTAGSNIEASRCMLNAMNAFLCANDIQRAAYSSDLMAEWLEDLHNSQDTARALEQAQTNLSIARARARGDGLDHLQRLVPWYFLVTFSGIGFSSHEACLEPNATFIYVFYSEAVENDTDDDAVITRANEVALGLKTALERKYFVFDGSNDSISVSPAVRLERTDGAGKEHESKLHPMHERFVSMDDEAIKNADCVFGVTCQRIPFVRRVLVRSSLFEGKRLSRAEKLSLLRNEMETMPCLPLSWSCLDWCKKLCDQEPLSYSVEHSIRTSRVSNATAQITGPKSSMPVVPRAGTKDEAAGKKRAPTSKKSKFKSRKVQKSTTSKAEAATPPKPLSKNRAYSGDVSALPLPPLTASTEPNPGSKLESEPAPLSIPSGDVPAWMLGMQDSLGSGSSSESLASPPAPKPSKKSAEAKKAMAYARSLGAFMAPEDAQKLMMGVEQESKVMVECVVTTDKGSKEAVAEITPDQVFIYYASKGMFGGSKKKTMYKFEMHQRLSVQEAPTPKLMMLMAPELNGEMLYINCDKRGMFKGAVLAFQKKLKKSVAQSGGGGDDGWGASAW